MKLVDSRYLFRMITYIYIYIFYILVPGTVSAYPVTVK